jgi:5-methyltetrahydrofolate--homocysteine methyltransferase
MNEETSSIEEKVYNCVLSGDLLGAKDIAQRALESGLDTKVMVRGVIGDAMEEVGKKYFNREIGLPSFILSMNCFKTITEVFKESLKGIEHKGKIVLGVVEKDIHSIGKNMVATMLEMEGYEVYDLGEDVPKERFIQKIKETSAEILGMSTLMTTTMHELEEVIELLEKESLREKVKVMVGGAPVTGDYAKQIGADGYGIDAVEAGETARELMDGRQYYGSVRPLKEVM